MTDSRDTWLAERAQCYADGVTAGDLTEAQAVDLYETDYRLALASEIAAQVNESKQVDNVDPLAIVPS